MPPLHCRLLYLLAAALLTATSPATGQAPAAAPPPPPAAVVAGGDGQFNLSVAGTDWPAYYLPETTGKAHGGVILVPDLNRDPAQRGLTNQLREALAEHHWHTLAINRRGIDGDMQASIAAAVQHFNQQGVYNIALLGRGQGAAEALLYAAGLPKTGKGQFPAIRALLMINASNRPLDGQASPLESITSVRIPVLDAYYHSDWQQQQAAQARRDAARYMKKKGLYQQARLPQINGTNSHGENRLTKRVRGWLDNNVAGFMVDQ